MSDIAIRVEGLSKSYQIAAAGKRARYKTLQEDLLAIPRRLWTVARGHAGQRETFWALREITFEVKQGEVLGVIGRNGAGKSTLLKILSRITEPTSGQADIYGRVGSLLEVGTGFHPELTGRENIFLSGAVLGMTRREVQRKFDEIVGFADIDKFVDTPAKHYSSGMYMRLAFSVAAHLEPEILLVDEVLAVGDAEFQKKCLGKMGEVAREGRTVMFVSHNLVAVGALCENGIVLTDGQLAYQGKAEAAIAFYGAATGATALPTDLTQHTARSGSGRLRFTRVSFRTQQEETTNVVRTGDEVTVAVEYVSDSPEPVPSVTVSIPFFSSSGQAIFMCWTRVTGQDFKALPSAGMIVVNIPRFPLREGRYSINLWCEVKGELADWVQGAASLEVVEADYFGSGVMPPVGHGLVVVDHHFRFHEADVPYGHKHQPA